MGNSIYVASFEGYTGKSTVALGLLEELSRRVERVGVFRPVVRADAAAHDGRDYVLDLLVSHEAVTLTAVAEFRPVGLIIAPSSVTFRPSTAP